MKNIEIYYRLSGRNHRITFSEGTNVAHDFCKEMAKDAECSKSEIQMVTADGISLYNSLMSEPVGWNDLEIYFSKEDPARTLIR